MSDEVVIHGKACWDCVSSQFSFLRDALTQARMCGIQYPQIKVQPLSIVGDMDPTITIQPMSMD